MTTRSLFEPGPQASLRERRAALEGAVVALDDLGSGLYEAGGAELEELVMLTDELVRRAEAARFAVVAEAHARGVVAESDAASLTAWVTQRAKGSRQSGGGGIARAVAHLGAQRNAVVREALESGRISVCVANAVIAEITRIESCLAEGVRDAVLEAMVTMGEDHGPRGVRQVRPELLARYGGADAFDLEQDRLRRGRALSRPTVDDGLHEYRLLLDPEGAATFEAAVEALSAPAPTEDPDTGAREPDLRTSDQRRADALLEIVRAAVSAMDTRTGRGAKATLLLTMGLDDLRAGMYAARALGGLDTGALLAPQTVRRLGCDAEVIPVVLGSAGEVLDQGRAVRLFTAGQIRNLWLRDDGCTYPGCTTPARWADAHHLVHWADGGTSDLDNAALLCQRHHTLVHQRRLHGHLDTGGGGRGGSGGGRGSPGGGSGGGGGSPGGGSGGGGGSPREGDGGAPGGPPRVVWDLSPGSYDRALIELARAG